MNKPPARISVVRLSLFLMPVTPLLLAASCDSDERDAVEIVSLVADVVIEILRIVL